MVVILLIVVYLCLAGLHAVVHVAMNIVFD